MMFVDEGTYRWNSQPKRRTMSFTPRRGRRLGCLWSLANRGKSVLKRSSGPEDLKRRKPGKEDARQGFRADAFHLSDGSAMFITIARYYTPSGLIIDHVGLEALTSSWKGSP